MRESEIAAEDGENEDTARDTYLYIYIYTCMCT